MTDASTFIPLCPGCFAEKGKSGTCPHCGYDESLKRGPLVLAHRTLLHNGQYLIGKVLGKPGGFGITYLALDTRLETRVAIKEYLPRDLAGRDAGQATISAHSSEDGEFFRYGLTQFLQEARTLARFDHANIVRVRNFFEENGTGYLVMDYYDGVTLADHLAQQAQGKLPEKTAVGIMMPILDGLREVHAKNFLHRDIKPQNIYLTTGNRPILLDFGAARQAMSERSRSLSVVLSEGYAPYEQYHRRGEQGPWTDIYACAAVLYHAVSGEPPPPATERMSRDELDIGALRVSTSLTNALRAGLAVDHKKRPQTMAAFQGLLLGDGEPQVLTEVVKQTPVKAIQSEPIAVPSPAPAKQSTNGYGFMWAAVVVMIGVIWFVMGDRGTGTAHSEAPTSTTKTTPQTPETRFKSTHAVAAIKANVRKEANAQAAIITTIERGATFSLLSSTDTFMHVRLPSGVEGYIAQGLVIPIADLDRLSRLTAQEYIDQRIKDKQIEKFLLQSSAQKGPFLSTLGAISSRSPNIKNYLQMIESSKKYDLDLDIPGAIWFSAAARFSMTSGFQEAGLLNARAAIQADPTNGELHVAYALAAFNEGDMETVKTVGRIVPMLSPMTTNAWLVFGLGETGDLKDGVEDATTTGAFILAIKLSRNAANTRKYLLDIAKRTENSRLKVLIASAIAEEAGNRPIFEATAPAGNPVAIDHLAEAAAAAAAAAAGMRK